MSSRIKFAALGLIAVLTVAIVWTVANASNGLEASPPPSFSAASPTPDLPADPTVATYVDEAKFSTPPPQAPTGRGTQSRLWVAAGSWWAVMMDPASRSTHIFELVEDGSEWWDTGTVIDDRPTSQADVLWDGTHLYVATAARSQSQSGAARILRYSLDTSGKVPRYVLDPNFPVTITPTGVDSIVLARDSLGTLWTTYVGDDGQVMVQSTVGGDLYWSKPVALPVDHSLVTIDDVAQVLAFGPGKVGIVWTSRSEGSVYLSGHDDGAPAEDWSAPETAVTGRALSSNQMRALGAPDGRLYVSVKTSLSDDPNAGGQSPQILLLTRALDATWSSVLYGRIQDQLGSPLLALDPAASIVYVMATSPKPGGVIVYKRTPAIHPLFESGQGRTFLSDPATPLIGGGVTTRDPIGPDTGLVVLAWDASTNQYVHGVMDLGGTVAAGQKPANGTATRPQLAFADDFDPWPAGAPPDIGWELRSNDPPTAFTIAPVPGKSGRSAVLHARRIGDDIRACKDFPSTGTGDVTIDVRVRLPRQGPSDAVMTEIRGPGQVIAASVRFGKNGYFAYFKGRTKARTQVPVRPGAWYRSVVTIHLASRTYDWKLLNGRNRVVLARAGMPWRVPGPKTGASVDRVCLQSPTGGRGIGLDWDDIKVIR